MLLRLTHLLLAVATVATARACKIDEDCSLNGICKEHGHGSEAKSSCVCDPGWLGSDCSALDVRPAKPHSGYNRTSEGISSWGSRIVRDDDEDGLFHLFLAEFSHHCGLDYWSPYSRIVRAESRTGAQGPYEFVKEVVGAFAHNPTVVWSEADKKHLMYYIGCPQEVKDECTTPSFTCGPGNFINGESGISVASSDNLRDWEMHGQIFTGDNGKNWDADVTNPTAFTLHGGHRKDEVVLVYRGCPKNCSADFERINVASSRSGFLGPYEKLTPDPLFLNSNEDPFVWQDKRGNWHMLLHSLEKEGGFGDGPKVGRHAFAREWDKAWTFVDQTLAFDTTVEYEDGTSIEFFRRERPQLLFSDDGHMRPLFLTTGVQPKDDPQSYSVIVPVGDHKEQGAIE